MNVLARDGEVGKGEVRDAKNVVLSKNGSMRRRAGYALAASLAGAHSLWSSSDSRVFVAAGTTLYLVQPDFTKVTLATGIDTGTVSYAEVAGDVFVACGRLLRVASDNTVTVAGVAPLLGFTPTLTANTSGGLTPGSYGFAVSAIAASGEESGLSAQARIVLTANGAVTVDMPVESVGQAKWNIYRTAANGGEMYLAATVPGNAATATIGSALLGRLATGWMKEPLPPGLLTSFNGRLFSASGAFVFYSDPFSALHSTRDGFVPAGEQVVMVIAVADGVYFATPSQVWFMAGNGPQEFNANPVADNGVVPGSATLADASMFNPELAPGTDTIAVWLTEKGYQLGLPGGRVVSPQSTRIALTGAQRATTTPFVLEGVKQLVSSVDALRFDGEADITP